MTIAELSEKAKRVDNEYRKQFHLPSVTGDWLLLKLQEELGEATRAYLALTQRTRHNVESAEQRKRVLAEEIADTFAYILLFANENNIDIEQAMIGKWFKYLPTE